MPSMRSARVLGLGLGLLIGSSAACSRDEASSDSGSGQAEALQEAPAQDAGQQLSSPSPDLAGAPPVGAWVRVSQERLLFSANVHTRLEIPFEDPFRTAEVVSLEGEFVKLRTLAAKPEDLCGTTSGADPQFEIHFFVEVDALQPVLREPKVVELDDGTKLEFAAGVPVDLSGPEPSLQVGAANFIVPLVKDEIGWWFPAAPAQPRAERGSSWSRSKPLSYGERSVAPDGPTFENYLASQTLGSDTLLTFADGCGRFTLRIEGEVPRSQSGLYAMKGPKDAIPKMARNFDPELAARNAGILGVISREDGSYGMACGPSFEAPAGATLTWEGSGNIAGVTRTRVHLPWHAQASGGKWCFTAHDMAVCIAKELLVAKDGAACPDDEGPPSLQPHVGGGGDPVGPNTGAGVRQVRQLKAEVGPGLDPDIVRRIVRAHINELRSCYNAAAAKQPQLAGGITIAFEIAANGKVSISTVHESTLSPADEALPKCFAKAVKRWQFPKPTGVASVSVTYPFELASQ
jgi:hypothetical protein